MISRCPLLTKGPSSPNLHPRRDAIRGPSSRLQAHVHPLPLIHQGCNLLPLRFQLLWSSTSMRDNGSQRGADHTDGGERDSRSPGGGGTGQGQGLERRKGRRPPRPSGLPARPPAPNPRAAARTRQRAAVNALDRKMEKVSL